MIDFREHLRRQLSFLQRSATAYGNGYLDEAYRIAIAVRVLIHNTSQSTSLLHHLNADSIPLLSTTEPASPKAVFYDGMSLIQVAGPSNTITIRPALDSSLIHRFVSARDWWTEEIYVHDQTRLCRKNIVLVAANQDGGAHVDHSLDVEYAQFKQGIWFAPITPNTAANMPEPQLIFLRQMAYEILNSPALNDLVQHGKVLDKNNVISPPTPKWTPPPVSEVDLKQMTYIEVDRLRTIVCENHFRLLDNLYHSSLGSATNPLGNYQVDQQAGYPWSLRPWLKPLLLENLITRSPSGRDLYEITGKGRAFVARIIEIGH